MKYKILSKKNLTEKSKVKDLINILLENRGIKTKKEKEQFLNPLLKEVTLKSAGISLKDIEVAKERIKKAIKKKEQIIVFGDYDVDGICGTAILWETLNGKGANVMPYIPHRVEEGYGLSIKGITNLKDKIKDVSLIITVDNGAVANEAVDYANSQGIDVIITDHHTTGKTLPKSLAFIHSKNLCGASVAWLFSKELGSKDPSHIELAAIATIADLVPLTFLNRIIAKNGIERLKTTKRIGLYELIMEAGLELDRIGCYEIGHIIAPRINAMGRMEYAMDSLRLLCTKNRIKIRELVGKVSETNRKRQTLTADTTIEIIQKVKKTIGSKKLVFISDEKYNQGIIGLVAGKLVEEFYLPSIVVSRGEKLSKASARSVKGFNIVEFIRSGSDFLVDVGGHPMAAGFTIETEKLMLFQKHLEKEAEKSITDELLSKEVAIDSQLPANLISLELFHEIESLSPFGPANPTPTFLTEGLVVEDLRLVGKDGKHLKLILKDKNENKLNAIAFSFGARAKDLKIGDKVTIVYVISKDDWNGNQKIQLKIKDLIK